MMTIWWQNYDYGDTYNDSHEVNYEDNSDDNHDFQLASQQHLRTGLGPEEPIKEKIYDITKVIMTTIAVMLMVTVIMMMMMMLVIMLMLVKMCLYFIHDNLHSIWLNGESKAMPIQIVT